MSILKSTYTGIYQPITEEIMFSRGWDKTPSDNFCFQKYSKVGFNVNLPFTRIHTLAGNTTIQLKSYLSRDSRPTYIKTLKELMDFEKEWYLDNYPQL